MVRRGRRSPETRASILAGYLDIGKEDAMELVADEEYKVYYADEVEVHEAKYVGKTSTFYIVKE